MKKIPILYSATGQGKKASKWMVITLIVIILLYIVSFAFWLSDFDRKGASLGIRIVTMTLQTVLISIIFTFRRNQSILINATNNTIVYHSGWKQFRIRPSDIKTVQFSGNIIEITAKKDKKITIYSEIFPKVDMQSLANYIKSLMSNEEQIKNDFFERENSGFHVTKKVVMETPNPWPHLSIHWCGLKGRAAQFHVVQGIKSDGKKPPRLMPAVRIQKNGAYYYSARNS